MRLHAGRLQTLPASRSQVCVPPYHRRRDLGYPLRTNGAFVKLQTIIVPLFAAVALVSGCASSDARYGSNDYRYGSVRSNEGYYGVIDSIESGPARNDDNAIAGTIIGGVIGGVIGHQVGSGRGNDVATVAGAVGGALVGHEVGKANGRQLNGFVSSAANQSRAVQVARNVGGVRSVKNDMRLK